MEIKSTEWNIGDVTSVKV